MLIIQPILFEFYYKLSVAASPPPRRVDPPRYQAQGRQVFKSISVNKSSLNMIWLRIEARLGAELLAGSTGSDYLSLWPVKGMRGQRKCNYFDYNLAEFICLEYVCPRRHEVLSTRWNGSINLPPFTKLSNYVVLD
ncbi:hypothetical protein J6590_053266 [Homalodisca vitripennis]|nr:hypothetical protein J6590_053266 [Homalodisca vitripennis]